MSASRRRTFGSYCTLGVNQIQRWKELPIKTAISRKKARSLLLSVSADQKIGKNADSLTSLLPICSPCPAREKMRLTSQRLRANFIAFKECIAVPLVLEVNAKLRIDDIANHNGAFACGLFKSIARGLIELLIGNQNIEQNIGIDSSDHRPRTSSMNLSTEE